MEFGTGLDGIQKTKERRCVSDDVVIYIMKRELF